MMPDVFEVIASIKDMCSAADSGCPQCSRIHTYVDGLLAARFEDAPTTTPKEPWEQPCDQPRTTFRRGVHVRHRNPKYADWRGIVEPETTGRHKGKCLRISTPFDSGPWAHIRWTEGKDAVGWYDVSALAPVTDLDGSAR